MHRDLHFFEKNLLHLITNREFIFFPSLPHSSLNLSLTFSDDFQLQRSSELSWPAIYLSIHPSSLLSPNVFYMPSGRIFPLHTLRFYSRTSPHLRPGRPILNHLPLAMNDFSAVSFTALRSALKDSLSGIYLLLLCDCPSRFAQNVAKAYLTFFQQIIYLCSFVSCCLLRFSFAAPGYKQELLS